VVEDEVVAETFLGVEDIAGFLTTDDPLLAGLLLRWADAHRELFTQDSPLLLAMSTHEVPALRAWGLERLQAVGMGLPFALRLLEAGLPQETALAAGSWAARGFLGLSGLEEGAPADLVAYPDDPRDDPEVLARPALRVLDGRLISPTIK
jgi:hypothetical protein